MLTQTVRTTISLPYDLHEDLRQEAFERRKSMGEVLVEKLRGKSEKVVSKTKTDWQLFELVAKKGKKIDLTAELRRYRGRDDN